MHAKFFTLAPYLKTTPILLCKFIRSVHKVIFNGKDGKSGGSEERGGGGSSRIFEGGIQMCVMGHVYAAAKQLPQGVGGYTRKLLWGILAS